MQCNVAVHTTAAQTPSARLGWDCRRTALPGLLLHSSKEYLGTLKGQVGTGSTNRPLSLSLLSFT